jgi:hypothetical protein
MKTSIYMCDISNGWKNHGVNLTHLSYIWIKLDDWWNYQLGDKSHKVWRWLQGQNWNEIYLERNIGQ